MKRSAINMIEKITSHEIVDRRVKRIDDRLIY